MATDMVFESVSIPQDETPPIEGQDYDPEYPGSTPDAPYGYKPDGTPYKRRPKGTANRGASAGGVRRMPATEAQAAAAAGMLAKMNQLIGIGFMAAGMTETALAIQSSNSQFESMAKEALLTDPALCKKILGAGATSGKAGLIMAYSMLGVSIFPSAKSEIQQKRAEREDDDASN